LAFNLPGVRVSTNRHSTLGRQLLVITVHGRDHLMFRITSLHSKGVASSTRRVGFIDAGLGTLPQRFLPMPLSGFDRTPAHDDDVDDVSDRRRICQWTKAN
jgi:hypothetical protein